VTLNEASGLGSSVTIRSEEARIFISFQPFRLSDRRRILRSMGMEDNVALAGDYADRVAQVLRMARHYARVAQSSARPRMQDALTELEDTLTDQLATIENAKDDDEADAEDAGEAERERQAWRPLRAA
jgi:hypothetical protein